MVFQLREKRELPRGNVKRLALFLIFGWCLPALAIGVPEEVSHGPRIEPLPRVNGYWCRSADGSWAWIANGDGMNPPHPRPRAVAKRRDPVSAPTRPKDRVRPDSVNGIKWFLDGRSYFSD